MKKERTTKTLKIDTTIHKFLKLRSTEKNKSMVSLAEDYIMDGMYREDNKTYIDYPVDKS